MALTKSVSADHGTITINVHGRFDYGVHRDFRETYRNESGPGCKYHVNLARTTYVDSSALGMLLLLREHAGGENAHVRITNANDEILNILRISSFDRLFRIE